MHFSVIVNGNPDGLKQGDPLSPFLFIVVIEALSKMLSGIVDGGFLSSFFFVGSKRSSVVHISHMLFTNDSLVFCGANPEHLSYLRVLFLCFEATPELNVNLAKSELDPVGNVDNVDKLAEILRCRVSSLRLKYLDLPLGASYEVKSIWNDVVEKI